MKRAFALVLGLALAWPAQAQAQAQAPRAVPLPPERPRDAPRFDRVEAPPSPEAGTSRPTVGAIRFPRRPGQIEIDPASIPGPANGPPIGLADMAGVAAPRLAYVPRSLPSITHGHRSVAELGCLPDSVLRVLADVSNRFGPVNVTSTLREGRGRSFSMHRFCRAADFRVEGVPSRTVLNHLRARGDVGGLKLYRNGLIHVDDSFVRSW